MESSLKLSRYFAVTRTRAIISTVTRTVTLVVTTTIFRRVQASPAEGIGAANSRELTGETTPRIGVCRGQRNFPSRSSNSFTFSHAENIMVVPSIQTQKWKSTDHRDPGVSGAGKGRCGAFHSAAKTGITKSEFSCGHCGAHRSSRPVLLHSRRLELVPTVQTQGHGSSKSRRGGHQKKFVPGQGTTAIFWDGPFERFAFAPAGNKWWWCF